MITSGKDVSLLWKRPWVVWVSTTSKWCFLVVLLFLQTWLRMSVYNKERPEYFWCWFLTQDIWRTLDASFNSRSHKYFGGQVESLNLAATGHLSVYRSFFNLNCKWYYPSVLRGFLPVHPSFIGPFEILNKVLGPSLVHFPKRKTRELICWKWPTKYNKKHEKKSPEKTNVLSKRTRDARKVWRRVPMTKGEDPRG